jgi:hypothetical protein
MFGDGTVTAVDANKLTIKLTDGRVKQIVDADKLTIRFNEIVDYYVKRRGRLAPTQGQWPEIVVEPDAEKTGCSPHDSRSPPGGAITKLKPARE